MQRTTAIIDIGSNTIKLLVAARGSGADPIEKLLQHTIEARLGQGISAAKPVLSAASIERCTEAVAELIELAAPFQPESTKLVATSAARDAGNREELAKAIHARTGLDLEILSGEREAELIGAAIQLNPTLQADDFYLFDLGGGSLECLRFRNGKPEQTASLPLGAVRLSEKFLADSRAPFLADNRERIVNEVKRVLQESGFLFSLAEGSPAIGTGGTLISSLNILAAKQGKSLSEVEQFLSAEDLRQLLEKIGSVRYEERLKIERLSPGRADVFPTALATFLALIDLAGTDGLHLSLLNLRFGLAAEELR